MADIENIGGDDKRVRIKCPFHSKGYHELFKDDDGKLCVEHFAPADKKPPKDDAGKKARKLPKTVLDDDEEEDEGSAE